MQENQNTLEQNSPKVNHEKTSNFPLTKNVYKGNIDANNKGFKSNTFVKKNTDGSTDQNNVKKVFKPNPFSTNKDSDKKPFKSFNKPENKFNSNFQDKKEFNSNNKFIKPEFAKKAFVKKIAPKINAEKAKIKLDSAIHGFYGTGRRKNSIAKVRIYQAEGNTGTFVINSKTVAEYFTRLAYQAKALNILDLLNIHGKFNIKCTVLGGGLTGQVGAIQLGLARALCEHNAEYRPILKEKQMLTRDSRMVLSKLINHVKSRKSRAFVKR